MFTILLCHSIGADRAQFIVNYWKVSHQRNLQSLTTLVLTVVFFHFDVIMTYISCICYNNLHFLSTASPICLESALVTPIGHWMREVYEWHVGMGGNDWRVGYTLAADQSVEECHGCYFEPSASDDSERRREIEEAHRVGVWPSWQRCQVDRRSVLLIVFALFFAVMESSYYNVFTNTTFYTVNLVLIIYYQRNVIL